MINLVDNAVVRKIRLGRRQRRSDGHKITVRVSCEATTGEKGRG
jgi:hypothetical protein